MDDNNYGQYANGNENIEIDNLYHMDRPEYVKNLAFIQ